MDNQIDGDRRRFLSVAAMTIAAARLGASDAGAAPRARPPHSAR